MGTQVFIIRHAEKLEWKNGREPSLAAKELYVDNHLLSPKGMMAFLISGYERAHALVGYFQNRGEIVEVLKNNPLSLLIAQDVDVGDDAWGRSERPRETIWPLLHSDAQKDYIQTPMEFMLFTKKQVQSVAKLIKSGKYDGKSVLISWSHQQIPELVSLLGVDCHPKKWDKKRFDVTWLPKESSPIKFDLTIDDGWRKDDTRTVAEKIELNTGFWNHASDKLGPTIPQTEEGVGNATVEDKQPEVKFVEAEITPPKQAEPGNLEIKEDEVKTPSPVKQKTKNVTIQEKLDQTASPISESVPKTPTSRKKLNTPSKSQSLSDIQQVFTDPQKIAYVGLCYLSIFNYKKQRLEGFKQAKNSYDKWAEKFMEKLYVYLELVPEERLMIESLAAHGLLVEDLSKGLLDDTKKAATLMEKQAIEKPGKRDAIPSDIRYTILTHLFLLAISDGFYDARTRTLLREIAKDLEIPYQDVVHIEQFIGDELRLYDESAQVKHDDSVVGERNKVEASGRWLYAGVATVCGGAIIGLTAGLAAPFIGAGIGAALTTFGANAAIGTGVGAFMASTGGVALITSGGVLTGGGMSGMKMMKRTKGIEEFEFLGLSDALQQIEEHRATRLAERRKAQKLDDQQKREARKQSPQKEDPHQEKDVETLWELDSLSSEGNSLDIQRKEKPEAAALEENESPMLSPATTTDEERNKGRQTNVLITVAGWVPYDRDDHTIPYSTIIPGENGDQYAVIWETKVLQELGSLLTILISEIASFIFQQGLQATILPILMSALTGPMWLIKLTYLVDNPWGNALTKAEKAGRLLADTLIGQVQNNRPVTLVGFSLGARLIYFCLLELAKKEAFGIIENVCMFGTPCVANNKEWLQISSVVSGRIVNGYTSNDMLLGVLYRASTALYKDVPGLSKVLNVPGVENVDLTEIVNGHMEYRSNLPKILKHVGFSISSEEFFDQDKEIADFKEEVESIKKQRIERRKAEYEQKQKEKQQQVEKKKLEQQEKKIFKPQTTAAVVTEDELVSDELAQMKAVEAMMSEYWQPREITSTLPPLVIDLKQKQASTIPPTEAGDPPQTDPVPEVKKVQEIDVGFESDISELSDF
ncbi:hypothetical protein HK103_007233 [Boothiomyces macroporosus]|uniref:DUF726-domain-containing protein n=1 Tax=Boothiomyces macroporosus TaxID=261099 RepID=A0AAD5UGQ2_9FUNG|nr:hypothetical protein HK103_007233 [Boothiomyces macroporosus]